MKRSEMEFHYYFDGWEYYYLLNREINKKAYFRINHIYFTLNVYITNKNLELI